MTDDKCQHDLAVPIAVEANDPAWVHWCATCGAVSAEGHDIEQPKSPWTLPGELTADDVARIYKAATG